MEIKKSKPIREITLGYLFDLMKRIDFAFIPYMTGIPNLVGNDFYLSDTLPKMFKNIIFNNSKNRFEFTVNKVKPETKLYFYVIVNEYKNFINSNKYDFELKRIEFYFKLDNQEWTSKLKNKCNNFKLLHEIFKILNLDGSLEEIYIKTLKQNSLKQI
jgi:hypothetical protein